MVYTLWPQMLRRHRVNGSARVHDLPVNSHRVRSKQEAQLGSNAAVEMQFPVLGSTAGQTWRTSSTARCRLPKRAGSLCSTSHTPVSTTCRPAAATWRALLSPPGPPQSLLQCLLVQWTSYDGVMSLHPLSGGAYSDAPIRWRDSMRTSHEHLRYGGAVPGQLWDLPRVLVGAHRRSKVAL